MFDKKIVTTTTFRLTALRVKPTRALALGSAAVVFLTACGATSPETEKHAASEISSAPWVNAPTDGVFEPDWRGDVSFGHRTSIPSSSFGPQGEYLFSISTPPILTTADGGETVTMASAVKVERLYDRGFGGRVRDENYTFIPGKAAPENRMDEAHGTHRGFECPDDQLRVGEAAMCTISFSAPASEIRNSYWKINGIGVGTWPSQIAMKP